jgi:integrase/recombinase XerD
MLEHRREPLTSDEVRRLETASESYAERLTIGVLLDTGLRVSELADIRRDDLDFQSHTLRIRGKGGRRGPRSKLRTVPLSARAARLLEPHLTTAETFGLSSRTVERIVRRVASRAGISRPCSPHVLRHTFAVAAIRKGITLPALQRILGHEHLSTTEIYLNVSGEDVRREFRDKW